MRSFKVMLAVLCAAIAVLCVLLAYAMGVFPDLSKCGGNTVFTGAAPEMPVVSESSAATTVQTTVTTMTSSTTVSTTLSASECRALAEEVINELSVNAGDKAVILKAKQLIDEPETDSELRALLSEILSFTGNNIKELSVSCGIDEKTAKQAAVSCWAQAQQKENTAVFSFAGDCTFAYYNEEDSARRFPAVYEKSGSITYPFDNVRGIFSADDITTVNFEGTLTDSTVYEEKAFYFRGKPEYAKILSGSSVESANLANNHSMDYLEQGFEDTVKALESEKISVFWASEPYVRSLRTDSGTVSVVMLSTSSLDIKNQSKFTELKRQIEIYESPSTIVIVNLHWGTERAIKPSDWQTETARELVDAGADLIVGHHPHILQGIEVYNGVYIAYSLGNFAFGGNSSARIPETIILRAAFDIDSGEVGKCSISAVPCYITSSGGVTNDYKPSLQYGTSGQEVIDLVLRRSALLPNGITELEWHGID